MKQCTKCGEWKGIKMFPKCYGKHTAICKACKAIYRHEYHLAHYKADYRCQSRKKPGQPRLCTRCKQIKPYRDFVKDGHRCSTWCKECKKAYRAIHPCEHTPESEAKHRFRRGGITEWDSDLLIIATRKIEIQRELRLRGNHGNRKEED